jgi:anti-sigma regulatory factor (Ser/Thr protein kinase)
VKTQNYSFELDNKLSDLKALNQHLIDFGRDIGLPELIISEINVCLDELFTNIVFYGFKDDRVHKIKFTIKVDGTMLIATMEDDGVPFNPLKKQAAELPTDVDSAQIGGLGIHITRELMDTINYERKRGINRVTVKKSIQADGDAPA